MTTQEIIAEQLHEIYGFDLEQVQTTAMLIAEALDEHATDSVVLSGREGRQQFQQLQELQREAKAALEGE